MLELTVFHKILSGEIPSHRVYEDQDVYAFLDILPTAVGHTLVIPKRAQGQNLFDVDPSVMAPVFAVAHRLGPLIVHAVGAEGFVLSMNNGTSAGQQVFYPHVHIIPRTVGDQLTAWPRLPERSIELLAADAERIRSVIEGVR